VFNTSEKGQERRIYAKDRFILNHLRKGI
jgi:hypothetical protein